ncbi:putative conserved transmembrane protein [Mycobacterium xenopi 3993]|nr:putative conserved transmembrane protein [Mycobacterium xenopi 3993]
MMVPERAAAFKDQFAKSTADLAQRNVTAQASTLSAGVEALGPSAASVAVVLRATQNTRASSRAEPCWRCG